MKLFVNPVRNSKMIWKKMKGIRSDQALSKISNVVNLIVFEFFIITFSFAEVRPPAAAGQFYPSEPEEISKMVEHFIAQASIKNIDGEIIALLVPHAGFVYSGSVAGWAYKNVAQKKFDKAVLVGASHYYPLKGAALYAEGSYSCLLKEFNIDENLAETLLKKSTLFEDLPEAHAREHSLEVQLPFLSKILPDIPIVPVIMNTEDIEICREVGEAIASAVQGKKVLLIASSDMSHYPKKETANKIDHTVLRALGTMDPSYLWITNRILLNRKEPNLSCTLCGEAAVLTVLFAAKKLGANRAVVLKYMNSGEVSYGDPSKVVGYGAVALIKSERGNASSPQPKLSIEEKKFLLNLAKNAIQKYEKTKSLPEFKLSQNVEMNLPSGVFVTLKKHGKLRGCIGSIQPQFTLTEAVIRSAISSAFEDHRFSPVQSEEIAELKVEISVIGRTRKVKNADVIRPYIDGVIVVQEGKSGLFLPSVWNEIYKKEDFLSELCEQKAGLDRNAWKDPKTELYVFTVDHFEE